MEFSKRLDLFGAEVFAALNEKRRALEAEGRTVYDLSVGTPDFKPSAHVMDALIESARNTDNWKYSLHDKDELLDAVAGYYKDRYGVDGIGHDMPIHPAEVAADRVARHEPTFLPENNRRKQNRRVKPPRLVLQGFPASAMVEAAPRGRRPAPRCCRVFPA